MQLSESELQPENTPQNQRYHLTFIPRQTQVCPACTGNLKTSIRTLRTFLRKAGWPWAVFHWSDLKAPCITPAHAHLTSTCTSGSTARPCRAGEARGSCGQHTACSHTHTACSHTHSLPQKAAGRWAPDRAQKQTHQRSCLAYNSHAAALCSTQFQLMQWK